MVSAFQQPYPLNAPLSGRCSLFGSWVLTPSIFQRLRPRSRLLPPAFIFPGGIVHYHQRFVFYFRRNSAMLEELQAILEYISQHIAVDLKHGLTFQPLIETIVVGGVRMWIRGRNRGNTHGLANKNGSGEIPSLLQGGLVVATRLSPLAIFPKKHFRRARAFSGAASKDPWPNISRTILGPRPSSASFSTSPTACPSRPSARFRACPRRQPAHNGGCSSNVL